MNKRKLWSLVVLCLLVFGCPMSVLAGTFEETSSGWHYRKDDGNYARSEWVLDQGVYYYLDGDGIMMADTTTPDGYLVGGDGSWVTERQVTGGYVRTPYDNCPYFYDPKWQTFIFDEATDYAGVNDTLVMSAVRGITPASELSEKNKAVYEEVCRFLTGFDYGASDYEKAKKVYEEITGRAVYHEGKYMQADDEAYSILVTGTGKCVGFARTYKLLANVVGLKCGIREDGAHMWNAVYVDGEDMMIDASTIGTSADFYLGRQKAECTYCGHKNTFGNRETGRPCANCGIQIQNPKYN